ncbi:MAG: efflux RND transporter periplasmic adaptor subunit [Planctomycetes bacterium]|nr:efflux RND transporter periplasmic adaptor subunit [Planctomycetota bacterium]
MRKNILTIVVFVALIGLFAWAANDWKAPWGGRVDHGSDWCEEHQVPESTCEKCNPKLARGGTIVVREREPEEGECPNTLARITLAPEAVREADIQFHTVAARQVSETVRGNAETMYPPSRYAGIAPRVGGVIREVRVTLGQDVEAGAVLAVIESPDLGEAKSDALQAAAVLELRRQTYEQEKALYDKKITAGRELLRAKTEAEEARLALQRAEKRLTALGLSAETIEKADSLLPVFAPFAGTIVEAAAVIGEKVGPEKSLFAIAALDRMWVSVDVLETDLPKVEKEQRVVFKIEGLPGRFSGRVMAIGGAVDERTRTVPVYAEVKNAQGAVRAHMFGRGEITVKPPEAKLLVPKEAVQSDGDCHLVFVSPADHTFKARKIEIGAIYESGYEVVGGLAAGEKVVTTGSFLLKSEVLRGQMGAG